MKKRVSIIGMGMLGSAWSIAFARAGCSVIGWDLLTEASNASRKVLGELIAALDKRNLLKIDSARDIQERINVADSIEQALGGTDWVQESVPEDSVENSRSAGWTSRYFGQLDLRDRAFRIQFRSAGSPPLSCRASFESTIFDPCG